MTYRSKLNTNCATYHFITFTSLAIFLFFDVGYLYHDYHITCLLRGVGLRGFYVKFQIAGVN